MCVWVCVVPVEVPIYLGIIVAPSLYMVLVLVGMYYVPFIFENMILFIVPLDLSVEFVHMLPHRCVYMHMYVDSLPTR